MRQKIRIIVVHGRGTKPSKACKLRYIRQVLIESVRRVDSRGARWLKAHPEAIQLAYYADITRRLLKGEQEPCASYSEPMRRLLKESQSCPNWVAFRGFMKDLGVDLAASFTRFLNLPVRRQWLKEGFPDVMAYFSSRSFASQVRQRLFKLLVPALEERARLLLLGHSLGSVVAYDCLWEISHLPRYKSLKDHSVDFFVTLGSPLGDETVKRHLLGSNRPFLKRYPTNIRRWVNLSARGDMICHDAHLKNDFRPMVKGGLLERFEEKVNLCNVYRGRDGRWNPHKLYGYFILPAVGEVLGTFLKQTLKW